MLQKMGPEFGTIEYDEQVKTVKLRIFDIIDLGQEYIDHVMVMFVVDKTFSRAAICQAEKEAKKEFAEKNN